MLFQPRFPILLGFKWHDWKIVCIFHCCLSNKTKLSLLWRSLLLILHMHGRRVACLKDFPCDSPGGFPPRAFPFCRRDQWWSAKAGTVHLPRSSLETPPDRDARAVAVRRREHCPRIPVVGSFCSCFSSCSCHGVFCRSLAPPTTFQSEALLIHRGLGLGASAVGYQIDLLFF